MNRFCFEEIFSLQHSRWSSLNRISSMMEVIFCRLLSFMEDQGARLTMRISNYLILNFIVSFCLTRLENLLFLSFFNFWGVGKEEWSPPLLVMKYSKNIVTI
jgi:hypothetical protein